MLQSVVYSITVLTFFAMSTIMPEPAVDEHKATLSGVVVDAATENPISNAVLTIQRSDKSAETGEDGTFDFGEVKAGEHSILIQAEGYPEAVQTVVLDSGRNHITLELESER